MPWGRIKELTPEQVEYARYLRKAGNGRRAVMCPRKIAKAIGVGEGAVRRALGLENAYCGALRDRATKYAVNPKVIVPQSVLEDRDQRMNAPMSLSVALL